MDEPSFHYKSNHGSEFLLNLDVNHLAKNIEQVKFSFSNNSSYFYKNYFSLVLNKFYKFYSLDQMNNSVEGFTIKISYAIESVATRSATTTRNEEGKFNTFLGGFSSSNVSTANVTFDYRDHYIMQFVLVIMSLPSLRLSQNQYNDILRYVVSMIAIHVLSGYKHIIDLYNILKNQI